MFEKHKEAEKPPFNSAIQPVKGRGNPVQGFLAAIGLCAIGAVAALVVFDRLPGDTPSPLAGITANLWGGDTAAPAASAPTQTAETSTAALLADIITAPPADRLAANAAPVPGVPSVAEPVSQPDLEDLVTRSIGTLANEPIRVAPAAEPVPVAAPVATTNRIDPNTLFTGASASGVGSCVDDLRNLASETRLYFPSGGVNVDDRGMVQARLIGAIAQSCPGVIIQVEGHSDPSGDPSINLLLSEERAQTVVARLTASGIDPSKFRAVGFGDRRPSGVRGTEPAAFYDRRVEFSVIEASSIAPGQTAWQAGGRQMPACVSQLLEQTQNTRLFFAPGSITVPQNDLSAVFQLAAAASACPEARLRVIGQYSDDLGSTETPATARLRAMALMSGLIASGFSADEIIIAAPSVPTVLANAPGASERRVDFDVIFETY